MSEYQSGARGSGGRMLIKEFKEAFLKPKTQEQNCKEWIKQCVSPLKIELQPLALGHELAYD